MVIAVCTSMKRILLFYLLAFTLFSCEEDSSPEDCPDDLICTAQFVVLSLNLEEDGSPIILRDYEVLNLDNNNRYTFEEYAPLPANGVYPVISDGQRNEINREGTRMKLIGTSPNGDVYETEFIVGHDCCHVKPISGAFYD